MLKKFCLLLAVLSCLVIGFYVFVWKNSALSLDKKDCAFCNTTILDHQKFYEDELVIALYSHKPILPGHCLIIPKRHILRFEMLTDAEMLQIGRVIKKVDQAVKKIFKTSSYFLLQKNDLEVQSVPHVHVHYLPREASESSLLKIFFNMLMSGIQKPISASEMKEVVEKLKNAIE